MSEGLRCMWMRGGTSKAGYFMAQDLPEDIAERDALLLAVMGSPDPRQIDGMGGGSPLTSKVAIVKASARVDADVDYLFLQVFVDRAAVSDAQNCGNILAGVGPFALERGLVAAIDGVTPVRIHMENTGQIAIAKVATPKGKVTYAGDVSIDGVPGTSAPISIEFCDTAGSNCGALFPTGNVADVIDGIEVTLIDNGMPCVILRATDLGLSGSESIAVLEENQPLRTQLEAIRLKAGVMMNLGDVAAKSVPKLSILSAPTQGGAIATRTFIPHQVHASIGVLGAVSVASACLTEGAIGADIAQVPDGAEKAISIEHPSGEMTVVGHLKNGQVVRAEILRTARKLMDGTVFAAANFNF